MEGKKTFYCDESLPVICENQMLLPKGNEKRLDSQQISNYACLEMWTEFNASQGVEVDGCTVEVHETDNFLARGTLNDIYESSKQKSIVTGFSIKASQENGSDV